VQNPWPYLHKQLHEIPHLSSADNHLQAYPNPANDFVTVEFSLNKSEEITFELSDVTGRVVMQQNLGTINSGTNAKRIDVSKLNSGVYVYSLTSSQGLKSGKLVIE